MKRFFPGTTFPVAYGCNQWRGHILVVIDALTLDASGCIAPPLERKLHFIMKALRQADAREELISRINAGRDWAALSYKHLTVICVSSNA